MTQTLAESKIHAQYQRAIVFTRYPQPGKTKTRLIPALGAGGAAELQRQMTEHTLARLVPLRQKETVSVEVRFTGGSRRQMQRWLGRDLSYFNQGSGDLGARLARAFKRAFDGGIQGAIAVGIDCPGIETATIERAFAALQERDIVLGPAADGGYYLIGLRRFVPQLFADIDWGTDRTLAQTVRIAESLDLSVAYLQTHDDIDRPDDLHLWDKVLETRDRTQKISAIVPVLNEAPRLQRTLAQLQTAQNLETIVVDGGSRDGSDAIALNAGARVVSAPRGRAVQMNAGAEVATGEILLFLHGDTQLPPGFDRLVRQHLVNPQTIAGAFELSIEGDLRGLKTIASVANWRSRHWQMPYGDQGLFMEAATFQRLGGFPELPLMEDFEFARRLKRQGRIAIVPAAVSVSGRRWQKLGVWRTTAINQAIALAYLLGFPPELLARWYWGLPARSVVRPTIEKKSGGKDEP